ncbi:hypothetical protein HZQ94_08935 [Elizabethkingia anophelis]|nr:hypothetical protein [Elizabethkingia anophelis]MCT3680149.1 hypothetical protein [Elizabethkingia anophelis]
MKTKYVKVPVSERLPEKEGCYPIILKNTDIIRDYYRGKNILSEEFWKIHIEYWLEEKEDHSEEMLSVLNRVVSFTSLGEKVPDFLTHEIEELINKVKDNDSI